MATFTQYYEGSTVPVRVAADPAAAIAAWATQRARLRSWLDDLPDDDWTGPTRCEDWDVAGLVRHLTSAAQFLGYTLHEAGQGTATTLLRGMDTRTTVASAAALLGDRSPAEARRFLASVDAAVEAALVPLAADGWSATAEAPPGHLVAHLVVSHFLFDSWVHEYDLLLPRGEQPVVDRGETATVLRYLLGFASVVTGAATPLDVRTVDPPLRIGVDVDDGWTTVRSDAATDGAAVIEGSAADVVDRLTGRPGGDVRGDPDGLAVLDGFSLVLST